MPVPNDPPTDSEIREVVAKQQNGHAAGITVMKAEHLKDWLCGVKREEAVDGEDGAGDCWRMFVALIKATWKSATVPTQMSWMVIMLLPKGGGEYCGIGLLDPMWKVVKKIMVDQMSCLGLHDCLQSGLPYRSKGTTIKEVMLDQQLTWVDQPPCTRYIWISRKSTMPWIKPGALKSWLAMGWRLICYASRNNSGTM